VRDTLTTGGETAQAGREIVRGLVFVCVAMVLLPGQDAAAKFASATVSVGQINWARFLLQTLLTLPFVLHAQGIRGLVPNRLLPNVVRGVLILTSSFCFFLAIQAMPLADALAIFFVSPFIITVLSALVEKEHVGWRRRIAVGVGFAGALIVIRPSYSVFGLVAVLPLMGAAIFSVYALMTRRYAAYDTALTMQFAAGVSGTVLMTLVLAAGWFLDAAPFAPSPMDHRDLFVLGLMGVCGTAGHLLLVQAARHVPASLFAPLMYLEIVAAALLGYAVFNDFPDAWTWTGIAVIVGSGAYVFWRESRRG
jgi:drug/metabolite transporter (DMT)-like permease